MLLGDLDEVPAGVVEDRRRHRPHGDGRLGEMDAGRMESIIFRLYVLDQGPLERPRSRVLIRLQEQFSR